MLKRTQLFIEGLSAYRAADKLNRAGIPVYSVQNPQKSGVLLEVASKDLKKVFAILRGSCYNVKKVRFRGLTRLGKNCFKRIGLFAGAALFSIAVLAMQSRVLRVDVTGSGAYYREEVTRILSEGGIQTFGAMPKDPAPFTAQILSLPRVSFCSLSQKGGVLTVEVQVSDESALRERAPLTAPVAGTVEEITAVRGTACVAVGDEVSEGQILVDCVEQAEGGMRSVIVIARVKLARTFCAEYGGSEESALMQARLEYGELRDYTVTQSENGYTVQGTAIAVAALNMR